MRLGTVIGRVTLNKTVTALHGARWLIVSPFTREHFQQGHEAMTGMSKDASLVVYDDLGGGVGQTIGFVEGREAASPFEGPTPVDAVSPVSSLMRSRIRSAIRVALGCARSPLTSRNASSSDSGSTSSV